MAIGGRRLKPKIDKKVDVAMHTRVGKDSVQTVDDHQRLMEVVVDKDKLSPEQKAQLTTKDQRLSMMENMDKRFREADQKDWDFSDYSQGFDTSGDFDEAEYGVLSDYVNEIGFNDKLRKNIKESVNDPDVRLLDSAMAKVDGLKQDTLAVRGSKRDFHETIGRELKVGEIFKDSGFLSTTVRPDISSNFMWKESPKDGLLRFGTIFKIDLPKGMKAMPVNISEFELLLPRNMNFEVLGNEKIDMRKESAKLPKVMGTYADMTQAMAGPNADPDMFKMRSIHLRALPNDSQRVQTKEPQRPKQTTVIRRKKKG